MCNQKFIVHENIAQKLKDQGAWNPEMYEVAQRIPETRKFASVADAICFNNVMRGMYR